MNRKPVIFILLMLTLLPVGFVAGQASSPNFVNQRSVLVSSDMATSANFRVRGTAGQAATSELISRNFRLNNGFYFGATTVPTVVGMGEESAETSLFPFWLLLATAFALLITAATLRRRTQ